ncbi:MAG: DUF427 domain-containing protein [Chloroflexaceae bacterium]|nr:DUF427 domain-containing protein [Chloroflexaceae bacterium]NJO06455.1 DUF427 domain-containing protein [Chloroflexaceae bacterium]
MKRPQPIKPGPGQESVWDYPRPPRLESTSKHIKVIYNGMVIAETNRALRVLETSHPPTYYIPPDDVQRAYVIPTARSSYCEWKGRAAYYTVRVGDREEPDAAWYYPEPVQAYVALRNYVTFYPGRMDACYVNDELVTAQPGGFYGGWITSDVVGPFKGIEGSWGW